MKLRLVCKAFDTAVYRVKLKKQEQAKLMVNHLTVLLKKCADLDLEYVRIHLETI